MFTISQIREKHKKEIEDFQNNCKHEEISDWMQYYWAVGHSLGEVKVCNVCEKIIESRGTLPEPKFVTSWT